MRRDKTPFIVKAFPLNFYSHASVRRDKSRNLSGSLRIYFYSHASVRRDDYGFLPQFQLQISTHTPLWGVTSSVHWIPLNAHDFYSHASVRRDEVQNNVGIAIKISTHTPLWGVTHAGNVSYLTHSYFYSHASVRRDYLDRAGIMHVVEFLLTRLCEAWLLYVWR